MANMINVPFRQQQGVAALHVVRICVSLFIKPVDVLQTQDLWTGPV
jgi:hypothetical protein